MANPTWFIEQDYLASKLGKLKAADAEAYGSWTTEQVKEAIEAAGMTPFDHFQAFNKEEGTSPNQYFNAYEYIEAKVKQLNAAKVGDRDTWTFDEVKEALGSVGGAWAHYQAVGAQEGLNPSNSFSAAGYYESKAKALGGDWTAETVAEFFKENGINPLDHYLAVGKDEEGVEAVVVPADQRVPADPTNVGTTFTLTTGRDFAGVEDPALGAKFDNVIKLTTGSDTLEGVVSALSSENTFNTNDLIDAGAGNDTAKISLKSNFTGFTAEGGMKGVENVELTNDSAIARTFDAKGIAGVEQYALNGVVSLTNLADTKAGVSISNIAETANVGIGFTADAVKGTADTLAVGVNGLGTAAVAATATAAAVASKVVTVTANGIETLKVNTSGANFVALAGDKVAAINVAGAGSITTGVTSTTKTFDASGNAGAVNVNLAGATGATLVATGAGDDTITADVSNVAVNATINGGEGADKLVLTGAGTTTQLQMTGIETLSLGSGGTGAVALTGNTVFSAAKASGIEAIEVQQNFTGATATFAGMGAADLKFNLLGNNGAGAVTSDHAGTTTVNVTAGSTATAAAPHTNGTGITAGNSTHVALNVGANTAYTGTVNAAKASAVEVNGRVNGATINAAEATSAVLNTSGASALTLAAGKLTNLNATVAAATGGTLNLSSSTLTAVQTLEANIGANSTFTTGNLDAANTVTLQGTGAAVLGSLGKATQEYGIALNAGSLSNLNVGGVIQTAAGQNINVNAASVLGSVTLSGVTVADTAAGARTGSITINANGTTGAVATGTLTAKTVTVEAAGALNTLGSTIVAETATVNGSGLGANTISLSVSKAATVVGGIQSDTFNIVTTGTGAAAAATVNFTGGIGVSDVVNVTGNSVFATSSFTGIETLALAGNSLQIDAATLANLVTSKTAVTASDVKAQLTVQATNAGQTIDASKVDTANIAGLTIAGGTGNDTLTGTNAGDLIKGGAGNDTINGGAGADIIFGGVGKDVLTGGGDADNFVFNGWDTAAAGTSDAQLYAVIDTITDFASGDNIARGSDAVTGGEFGSSSKLASASGTDALGYNASATVDHDVVMIDANGVASFHLASFDASGSSFTFVTKAPTDLNSALLLLDNVIASANVGAVFNYDGKVFAFFDGDTAASANFDATVSGGGDIVVELTGGISAAEAAGFIFA